MADPLKERISLLEMGEAQGKLKPEHQAELNRYRAAGIAKGRSASPSPMQAGAADQDPTAAASALETASARDKARAGMATIARIEPALARVKQLQTRTQSASGLAGLAEYNPFSSDNQQYDAAVNDLKNLVRPATRTVGEGSMSDFESKMATAIIPDRWRRDAYNNEALSGLDRIVSSAKQAYRSQLGLPSAPPSTAQARPSADALRAKYGLK